MFQKLTFFTSLLVVAYLYFFGNKIPPRSGEIDHKPSSKSKSSSMNLQPCCNSLSCPPDGTWYKKSNISNKALLEVLELNKELRLRKGWPAVLYRDTQRCGSRYPLARSVRRSGAQYLISDIIAQCNLIGKKPCCLEDYGLCGQGSEFCSCKTCTDYRNTLFSELSKWEPKHNCTYKKLVRSNTCRFLGEKFTSVTFIGDSLVRHTFTAILMHLTDDLQEGGLKVTLNKRWKEYCKAENQFVDSSCHVKLATQWSDIIMNKKYCSMVNNKIRLSFVQAFSTNQKNLAVTEIRRALEERKPLIIIGIGIHDNFNASKVIEVYLKQIVELKNGKTNSTPVIIWLNTHAAGALKPLSFQKTQGNKQIIKFNNQLRDYCHKHSIYVYDTYNLTKDVHSFDGTHYGSVVNLLKVKLLINALQDKTYYDLNQDSPS